MLVVVSCNLSSLLKTATSMSCDTLFVYGAVADFYSINTHFRIVEIASYPIHFYLGSFWRGFFGVVNVSRNLGSGHSSVTLRYKGGRVKNG